MNNEEQAKLDAEELTVLKQRLTDMGVKFHHNAKLETLQTLLSEALEPKDEPIKATTREDEYRKVKAKMLEPVRVSISCNNKMKANHKGEFFTTGNSLVGALKAFIPYNVDAAQDIRIPRAFINLLRSRQFMHTSELTAKEKEVSKLTFKTVYLNEFVVVELGDK